MKGEGGQSLLFVNDSKATNAEATATALGSFSQIYWLAGGRAKEGGIEPLIDKLGPVNKAFLFGEAAADFGATLRAAGIDFEQCGDLQTATECAFVEARLNAQGEAAILLSPAAASFDQYPNFEVRGEAFCQAVKALEGPVLYDTIDVL